jgi:hypothetical protein
MSIDEGRTFHSNCFVSMICLGCVYFIHMALSNTYVIYSYKNIISKYVNVALKTVLVLSIMLDPIKHMNLFICLGFKSHRHSIGHSATFQLYWWRKTSGALPCTITGTTVFFVSMIRLGCVYFKHMVLHGVWVLRHTDTV